MFLISVSYRILPTPPEVVKLYDKKDKVITKVQLSVPSCGKVFLVKCFRQNRQRMWFGGQHFILLGMLPRVASSDMSLKTPYHQVVLHFSFFFFPHYKEYMNKSVFVNKSIENKRLYALTCHCGSTFPDKPQFFYYE